MSPPHMKIPNPVDGGAHAALAARMRDSFYRQPAMHTIGAELSAIEPGYAEVTLPPAMPRSR
jgi:acyl-coenzyme A thioesterase PaaI-like protein